MKTEEIRKRVKACVDNSTFALALIKLPDIETELLESLRNVITEANRALDLIKDDQTKRVIAVLDLIKNDQKTKKDEVASVDLSISPCHAVKTTADMEEALNRDGFVYVRFNNGIERVNKLEKEGLFHDMNHITDTPHVTKQYRVIGKGQSVILYSDCLNLQADGTNS